MFQFNPFSFHNTEEINSKCGYAQKHLVMLVIIGYTGAGKTFALNYYHSKNPWVYKITLGESIKAKDMYGQFLNQLTGEKKIRRESRSILIRLIEMELERVYGKGLIIIDECGTLKKQELAVLRELRDLTKSKLGMVLFGPDDFLSNVRKWQAEGVVGIEELSSRIFDWIRLKRPSDEEIAALFKSEGIMKYAGAKKFLADQLEISIKSRTWRDTQKAVQKFFDTSPKLLAANKTQK